MKRSFSILIFLLFMLCMRSAFSESQWPINFDFDYIDYSYVISDEEIYLLTRKGNTCRLIQTNTQKEILLDKTLDKKFFNEYKVKFKHPHIELIHKVDNTLFTVYRDLLNRELGILIVLDNGSTKKHIIINKECSFTVPTQNGIACISKECEEYFYHSIFSDASLKQFKLKGTSYNNNFFLHTATNDRIYINREYFDDNGNKSILLDVYDFNGKQKNTVVLSDTPHLMYTYKDNLYVIATKEDTLSNTFLKCFTKNGEFIEQIAFDHANEYDWTTNAKIFIDDKNIHIITCKQELDPKDNLVQEKTYIITLNHDFEEMGIRELDLQDYAKVCSIVEDMAYFYIDGGHLLYKVPLDNVDK